MTSPAPAAPADAPLHSEEGWRPVGQGGGFTHPTQAIEFRLERIEPRDGTLEVTPTEPDEDEIGKRFGSGTYRLTKREGTKLPVCRDIIISKNYGDPRYPNQRTEQSPPREPRRFLTGRNDEDDDRLPARPLYRPSMDVRPYQQDHRSMADVARSGLSGQESIAVTAVSELAKLNEKNMDRMDRERDRDRQPQTIITDFLKEQQIAADKRAEDERNRRDEERKNERAEWDRRETERENQHKRDMDRMKLENEARINSEREARNGMMELEKQRLVLMREESKIREDALKGELERIRTEAKEERKTLLEQLEKNETKTGEQLEEVQESVKEELAKEREGLKREHELKERHLDNEQKLKEEMLKLREEIVKGQQGEDISKVLTKLVEGIERTVKEVVDLKKIEAVSAEDRLSKIGQAGGAPAPGVNVTQQPAAQKTPPEQPAAMQGQKTGNGHAGQSTQQPQETQAGAGGQDQTPEVMIRQLAREQVFVNMISKWAKQVQANNDAGIFSNMFMELMRDDGTVEALKIRKACSWFVDEMSTKPWAEMYDFLKPAIPQNLYATFETPHAEVFYDQFKMMVVESVRDYWRMYFAQKQQEIEAAKQAAQGAATPAAQPEAQPPQQPSVPVPSAPTLKVPDEVEEPKPEVTVDAA